MSGLNTCEKLKTKFPTECSMCGAKKVKSTLYRYLGHKAVRKLKPPLPSTFIICEKCAMKEEFGTKWKQSKRYKKWIKDNDET